MDGWDWGFALATAVVSAITAVVGVWYARRQSRQAAEELATRFREPLLQAVSNLQSRIYNIVMLDFLGKFLGVASAQDEREYAELNTLYVFGQYFCWLEIIRRESQYLDPRNIRRNREMAHRLADIRESFSTSIDIDERAFRLFLGEQRALGEVMLAVVANRQPGEPKWECLGYAAFVRAVEDDQIARWFRSLRESIRATAGDPAARHVRLRLVQRGLMEVIDALDPDARRIPPRFRKRLDPPVT